MAQEDTDTAEREDVRQDETQDDEYPQTDDGGDSESDAESDYPGETRDYPNGMDERDGLTNVLSSPDPWENPWDVKKGQTGSEGDN